MEPLVATHSCPRELRAAVATTSQPCHRPVTHQFAAEDALSRTSGQPMNASASCPLKTDHLPNLSIRLPPILRKCHHRICASVVGLIGSRLLSTFSRGRYACMSARSAPTDLRTDSARRSPSMAGDGERRTRASLTAIRPAQDSHLQQT